MKIIGIIVILVIIIFKVVIIIISSSIVIFEIKFQVLYSQNICLDYWCSVQNMRIYFQFRMLMTYILVRWTVGFWKMFSNFQVPLWSISLWCLLSRDSLHTEPFSGSSSQSTTSLDTSMNFCTLLVSLIFIIICVQ